MSLGCLRSKVNFYFTPKSNPDSSRLRETHLKTRKSPSPFLKEVSRPNSSEETGKELSYEGEGLTYLAQQISQPSSFTPKPQNAWNPQIMRVPLAVRPPTIFCVRTRRQGYSQSVTELLDYSYLRPLLSRPTTNVPCD